MSGLADISSRLENWWFAPFNEKRLELFRKAVYLFCIYFGVSNLTHAEELFGPNGYLMPEIYPGWSGWLNSLLSFGGMQSYWWVFVALQLASAILGWMGKFRFWSHLVLTLTMMSLVSRTWLMQTGGHQLLVMLMIYFTVYEFGRMQRNTEWRPVFSRLAFWLCVGQVLLVYLASSVYKLMGLDWLNGTALKWVFSIEQFSLHPLTDWIVETPWVYRSMTYLSLGYQLLFPVLVFVRPVKKWFLLLGVLFHLGIAILMGVFDFGVIMVITYFLFVDVRWPFRRRSLSK